MWLNIEAFRQVTTKQLFVVYLLVTSSKFTKVTVLGTLSNLSRTMSIRGIADKRPQNPKHNGAKHFYKIAFHLIQRQMKQNIMNLCSKIRNQKIFGSIVASGIWNVLRRNRLSISDGPWCVFAQFGR